MIPPRTTPNGFSSAAKPMVASCEDSYFSANFFYFFKKRGCGDGVKKMRIYMTFLL